MILLFLFKRKGLAENFWELRPIFVLEQTHLVRYGFASFTWICHGFYFISITIILCQKVIPFFGLVLIIWLECPFLLVVLYLLILLGIFSYFVILIICHLWFVRMFHNILSQTGKNKMNKIFHIQLLSHGWILIQEVQFILHWKCEEILEDCFSFMDEPCVRLWAKGRFWIFCPKQDN